MILHNANEPSQLTRALCFATTIVASAALLIGPLLTGAWPLALAALALGVFTIVAIAKDWGRPLGTVEFIGFVFLATLETLRQIHPLWGLIGVAAALATWDLRSLRTRMSDAGFVAHPNLLLRHHLTRLSAVVLLGVALGAGALVWQINYDIGAVVGLACLCVLGLSRIVAHIRRRSD
jgi:hypothetical protein